MSLESNVQEGKAQKIQAKEIEVQDEKFTVSASPHIRCNESISKIMWNVNLALAPAAIFSIFYFGFPALINMIAGVASAVVCEYLVQNFRKKRLQHLMEVHF